MHSMSVIIPKVPPTDSSGPLLRIVSRPPGRPCVYLSLVGPKHISGPLSLERLVLFSMRTSTHLLLAPIFTGTFVLEFLRYPKPYIAGYHHLCPVRRTWR